MAGSLGYTVIPTPTAPDTGIYGRMLAQGGLTSAQFAEIQRQKQLDEEKRLAFEAELPIREAEAQNKAAETDIRKTSLQIQQDAIAQQEKDRKDALLRQKKLDDLADKERQEKLNEQWTKDQEAAGFSRILSRDSEPTITKTDETGEVITQADGKTPFQFQPEVGIQKWLGQVPFENLNPQQKQIVGGYGIQMGIPINKVESVYEDFRKGYVGAKTERERQSDKTKEKAQGLQNSIDLANLESKAAIAQRLKDKAIKPPGSTPESQDQTPQEKEAANPGSAGENDSFGGVPPADSGVAETAKQNAEIAQKYPGKRATTPATAQAPAPVKGQPRLSNWSKMSPEQVLSVEQEIKTGGPNGTPMTQQQFQKKYNLTTQQLNVVRQQIANRQSMRPSQVIKGQTRTRNAPPSAKG
jgi:hypothetical protein